MNHKERVWSAIRHKKADRVPKGETWIDGTLSNKLLQKNYPNDYQHFERDLETRNFLGMDLVNVGDWPFEALGLDAGGRRIYRSNYGYEYIVSASKHVTKPPVSDIADARAYRKPDISKVDPSLVRKYATQSDLFVFGQIGGPVSMLDEMFDMEDFMVYSLTHTSNLIAMAEKVMEYEIEKARLFIDNGADAIFFADDIAFNSGVFLPPRIMDELVFPFYRTSVAQIKKYKNVPVFAHSDGNINTVLEKYVECGFDGLQSLQPSAGMDIADVKKRVGEKLCLWGNIDLDHTMCFGTPREVEDAVHQTLLAAGQDGGLILSTCNTMTASIPPENVLAMMRAAEEVTL